MSSTWSRAAGEGTTGIAGPVAEGTAPHTIDLTYADDVDDAPTPPAGVPIAAPASPVADQEHLTAQELVGFAVEAIDGKAGTVTPHTAEVDPAHLVVRTGPLGHEVVVETEAIREVDADAEVIHVDRVKAWVKESPSLKAYKREH